jgi:hypothetical protein
VAAQRLRGITGVDPLTAAEVVATVGQRSSEISWRTHLRVEHEIRALRAPATSVVGA